VHRGHAERSQVPLRPAATDTPGLAAPELLADRIGRSKSWIEKVEAGTRSANRLPILDSTDTARIDKWACGICDTLALGILVEAIGKKLPTVALPFTNYAHAAHPAFVENIEKLRSWGVRVLFGPDVYPLHEPGTGSQHLDRYPWLLTLDALREMTNQPESA